MEGRLIKPEDIPFVALLFFEKCAIVLNNIVGSMTVNKYVKFWHEVYDIKWSKYKEPTIIPVGDNPGNWTTEHVKLLKSLGGEQVLLANLMSSGS